MASEWRALALFGSRLLSASYLPVLRYFRVSSTTGQQAVDIYFVLCAYIYMPVYDGRDVEP